MLEEIDYWDVDIIPEDWHLWTQAFFTLGERVRTIPLYLPIVRDGVLRPTLWKTLHMRYEQEKRWAWGATDVPYIITRFFHSPHVNVWAKLRRVLFPNRKSLYVADVILCLDDWSVNSRAC